MVELFGSQELRKGSKGIYVVELQLRLTGFHGTVWDGDFGAKTELQVKAFQEDYMSVEIDGIAGDSVFADLDAFADMYSIDFEKLKCQCGNCGGFGNAKYRGEYRQGKPEIEAYYKYEYPGIHKAILHSFSAAQFYAEKLDHGRMFATCGYRCSIRNKQKNRTSTNHCGKSIDADLPMNAGDDKADDVIRCNSVRDLLAQKSNFQIGWTEKNKKLLEPGSVAPSWLHASIRNYEQKYLEDIYFVKNNEGLLRKELS